MPNWHESMQQTFEYYIVDPSTWKDKDRLENVKTSTISRDSSAETLGSASIDLDGIINECYIRIYLITIQNGIREKIPLATVLVQTPSTDFDGKVQSSSIDAYTPLLELKDNQPPIGYSVLEGENIMDIAYRIIRENVRAPVVETQSDKTLVRDFVANTDDTWTTFARDLVAQAGYSLSLDEMGRIMFAPDQDVSSMQPVWTFSDDNSSILYPDFNLDHDLYGIPNVVEVIYSTSYVNFYAKAVNDDPNSPISTVRRGRQIVHRVINPDLVGIPSQDMIKEHAEKVLRNLSSLDYTITYSHGYCPVRVGDCVRLNYKRAGLSGVKAKVISQSIKCEPGTPVEEKAVFTMNLWR